MSEAKAKKNMLKAHNEVYQYFNNLMELQSMEEIPQFPEKQQRPLALSTSKQIEAPYSMTEINGNGPIRRNSESNDNTLSSSGKFIYMQFVEQQFSNR